MTKFCISMLFISIHSLRMEGDPFSFLCAFFNTAFQSTPSAWRETNQSLFNYILTLHFNPLPPHGGRQFFFQPLIICVEFQSTPSAWRETTAPMVDSTVSGNFNPLPPHGGRRRRRNYTAEFSDFNPLPPHGGRPRYSLVTGRYSSFQSTPSAWRETSSFHFTSPHFSISIHSLRMEGD